jgi:hypothetical protein
MGHGPDEGNDDPDDDGPDGDDGERMPALKLEVA